MDFFYPLELDGNDVKLADNRNLAVTEVLSPILTSKGERKLQPDYGGYYDLFDSQTAWDIRQALFEAYFEG